MESFWSSLEKTALEAAEKAKSVAKTVSQKGIEFAEATAEEAGKKLKDLGISDTIGSSPKQQGPPQEELLSYGITPEFMEFIRSLNYNTFREYPIPEMDAGADPPALSPWQVRHAMLVVRAVNEVNELRYVLCPRYMDDQRFWQVYFALAQAHLPAAASNWKEGDPLPPVAGADKAEEEFMSLGKLQSQLKSLGSKLQAAASKAKGPGGVELATILPLGGSTGGGAAASTSAPLGSGEAVPLGGQDSVSSGARGGTLLDADPDLEAYLQVADDARAEGEDVGGDDAIVDDDELDLDQYLNELSAEVGEEDGQGGGEDEDAVDVEDMLKELQEEDEEEAPTS